MRHLFTSAIVVLLLGCDGGKAARDKARLDEIERARRENEAAQAAITRMNKKLFSAPSSAAAK